jgi:hypothetical protein
MNGTVETKQADLKPLRMRLHNAIKATMSTIYGFCTSDALVEAFKRAYLWEYYKAETSRSMSEHDLKSAAMALTEISTEKALEMILKENPVFKSKKDVLKCTAKQICKIKAIANYRLELTKKDLITYVSKTLGREAWLFDLSISEAHHIIERLEKWEAKALLK